ncbi:unnamed protein product [Anisakis simplex]|nr:unnamed protein product [Anisakis simplex]
MPSAISEGNHYWLGEYEQCSDLKKSGAFDGRYCLLQVEVPDSDVDAGCPQHDPLRIDLGICSPESCSEAEVNRVLRCEFNCEISELLDEFIPIRLCKQFSVNG